MAVIGDKTGRATTFSDGGKLSTYQDSDINAYDWNAFAYNDYPTAHDTSGSSDVSGQTKTHTDLVGRATSYTDRVGRATSHTDKKQNSVVTWDDSTYTWDSTVVSWDGYRL